MESKFFIIDKILYSLSLCKPSTEVQKTRFKILDEYLNNVKKGFHDNYGNPTTKLTPLNFMDSKHMIPLSIIHLIQYATAVNDDTLDKKRKYDAIDINTQVKSNEDNLDDLFQASTTFLENFVDEEVEPDFGTCICDSQNPATSTSIIAPSLANEDILIPRSTILNNEQTESSLSSSRYNLRSNCPHCVKKKAYEMKKQKL